MLVSFPGGSSERNGLKLFRVVRMPADSVFSATAKWLGRDIPVAGL